MELNRHSDKEAVIISGGVYPELAQEVSRELGRIKLKNRYIETNLKKFDSGERYTRIAETVRDKDLYVFQTFLEGANGYSVNDAIIENELMIDAGRRASAHSITSVMPFYPYGRQDRKAYGREPISAARTAICLAALGVSRIVTFDVHSDQTQGYFHGPFDNVTARGLMLNELKFGSMIGRLGIDDAVVIAPDAGSLKDNEIFANELGLPVKFIPKARGKNDSAEISRKILMDLNVENKKCIIVDDIFDTAGTLVSGAELLKKAGANWIGAYATHGLLSGPAVSRIKNSSIDKVVVTDTVPQAHHSRELGKQLKVLPICSLLARTIELIHNGESVSDYFDGFGKW